MNFFLGTLIITLFYFPAFLSATPQMIFDTQPWQKSQAEANSLSDSTSIVQQQQEINNSDIINILVVKERLAELGFYSGPINSIKDGQTIEAIKRFQSSQNFFPSGVIDEQTKFALGLEDSSLIFKLEDLL